MVRLRDEQTSVGKREDLRNETRNEDPAARTGAWLESEHTKDPADASLMVWAAASLETWQKGTGDDVSCRKEEAAETGNQAKPAILLSNADTPEPLQGSAERLELMMLQSLSRTLNHHP